MQGRRKRYGWSGLGLASYPGRSLIKTDQLSELGGCGNMRSINIGGCGNVLLARVVCASMQRADPEQLQNVEQLQQAS